MINFLPFIDGESIIERITDLELVSYVDGDIIDMADGPRDEAPLVSLVIQRTGPYSKINHHFYIVTDGDGWAQIADTYIDDDVDNLDAYGKWVSRPTLATITLSNEDKVKINTAIAEWLDI